MKEKVYIAIKAVLIACLLTLIVPYFMVPKDSSVPFDTVVQETTAGIDMGLYPQRSAQDIKRYVQLVPGDYEHIAFYRSTDAMNASELLIVQFKENSQSAGFEEKIDERTSSQEKIYAGYAPEQEQLVKDHALVVRANYALYVVGAQADIAAKQFEESIRG